MLNSLIETIRQEQEKNALLEKKLEAVWKLAMTYRDMVDEYEDQKQRYLRGDDG